MDFMDWDELFCNIDDFCQPLSAQSMHRQIPQGAASQRKRKNKLCLSEVMTILVGFHQSGFKCFKRYYQYLLFYKKSEFPALVSYTRFVELIPASLIPLCAYLNARKGNLSGITFIDSTSLVVCKNKRIKRNRVFQGLAKIGKSTMGWFFGFKLHIAVNETGDLLAFKLTPANTDDRTPVPELSKGILGKLFGDKGYISENLFNQLMARGLQLITGVKKNMKNRLLPIIDKILLRKRSVIETVFDQLKSCFIIEHSRHKSVINFMVNLVSALIAYTYQEKRPSIKLDLGAFRNKNAQIPLLAV